MIVMQNVLSNYDLVNLFMASSIKKFTDICNRSLGQRSALKMFYKKSIDYHNVKHAKNKTICSLTHANFLIPF